MRQMVLDHQFSPNRYTDFINTTLNEAQRRVARRASLRAFFDVATISVTAGTSTYTLPTNFARLYSLEDTAENRTLDNLSVSDYDAFNVEGSSGRPIAYTIDRPNIALYPNPNSAYSLQLRYYRTPAEMTADEDEPEIPEDYHYVLVSYTLARCFRRENDYEATQFHKDEYERELAEMMADLQDDSQDAGQPQQVGGTWNDEGMGITVTRP